MEKYVILTINCIVVFIVGVITGKKIKNPIIKPSPEEILKMSIENVKFLNTLNPIVVEIYKLFINPETLKYFQEATHTIIISYFGEDIKIWSTNELWNREFTSIDINLLKKYDLTLNEVNKTLTLTDKKILDYIVQAIKTNNKEFINRVFI